MGARDQLGRAGAAARKLEKGDLIGRGRAGILRQITSRFQPIRQTMRRRILAQKEQMFDPARAQLIGKDVVAKQLMRAAGDDGTRRDLRGIGRQFQPAMAEQRIDRRDPDPQQGEKDDIELGHIGQLNQRRIPPPQPGLRQPRGQVARQPVQIGIAETAVATDQRLGRRVDDQLRFKDAGQGLVDPISGRAITVGKFRWPWAEFDHGKACCSRFLRSGPDGHLDQVKLSGICTGLSHAAQAKGVPAAPDQPADPFTTPKPRHEGQDFHV